jgi:hypothetical protein
VTDDDLVPIDLTDEERYVLFRGLAEWGGPAHCTDALAAAIDFANATDMLNDARRLRTSIEAGQPLNRRDWRRILAATEIAFASDIFGSGIDWSITSGLSDENTIKILRSLQRKIARSAKIHQL